jgi:hypothetical protein
MNALLGVAMDRDELILKLTHAVAGDPDLVLEGWSHLVLVSVFDDGMPDMTGFCYTAGGKPVPVSPSDLAILDVIGDLRAAMAEHDRKAPWVACLMRVSRESGAVTFEYEYEDASRWAVTPANVRQRAGEFAPAGPA